MMLRAALGFFTRLPIGSAPLPPTFRGVAVWLPVVGLIIGALVSLALGLAAQLLPASLCGVIGCLVWVAVTGGLHLDGVADCGDGLIVEAPPARRLEIMKDSRLGTFGGAALFFILALKAAALGALAGTFQADGSGPDAFAPLLLSCCLAGTLARCMVFAAMRVPCRDARRSPAHGDFAPAMRVSGSARQRGARDLSPSPCSPHTFCFPPSGSRRHQRTYSDASRRGMCCYQRMRG